jgi:hypothetical protein
MREVRLALLEADVNFKVVKDFVARVRERAIGHEVLDSLSAGQQVVKIVNDELVALLSAGDRTFHLSGNPAVVAMVGLQGSGKTTSTAGWRDTWRSSVAGAPCRRDPYRPGRRLPGTGAPRLPVHRAPSAHRSSTPRPAQRVTNRQVRDVSSSMLPTASRPEGADDRCRLHEGDSIRRDPSWSMP